MPRIKEHESPAARQRAYRERQQAARAAEQQEKGLPPSPPLPNAQSKARWRALIERAHLMLETAQTEMQEYHDERSETWQESDKAEELRNWIEQVEQAKDAADQAREA